MYLLNKNPFFRVVSRLTAIQQLAFYSSPRSFGVRPISTNRDFNTCVVLEKDAFDPDAVFHDDIVDDDVLPRLSLAVDGLTDTVTASTAEFDLALAEATSAAPEPDEVFPTADYDPEQLEVYGWESSVWRKIRGYLGF